MGMYDEVSVKCRECGDRDFLQSKAGPCILKIFTDDDLPPAVAADIKGKSWWCESCDAQNIVEFEFIVLRRMR